MVSETKRRNNDKWDAAHMKWFTVKVRDHVAGDFKAACKAAGKTPTGVLRETIIQTIDQYKKAGE